ncbi:MAG: protein-L-IsoD(D-D) O-methyltransferase, partial [Selenomonadaceae bacterium]|nr:protein-L-IsoD(D-D) O-methyltransferase [Selenomonadaceae bacterium]
DFLREQPDKSFDVVYFDPMFRHPLMESENLNPLRAVADHRPVSLEAISEAKRVARHRVVLKENSRSLEFARLGFTKMAGGQYSKIRYGVYETMGACL